MAQTFDLECLYCGEFRQVCTCFEGQVEQTLQNRVFSNEQLRIIEEMTNESEEQDV